MGLLHARAPQSWWQRPASPSQEASARQGKLLTAGSASHAVPKHGGQCQRVPDRKLSSRQALLPSDDLAARAVLRGGS